MAAEDTGHPSGSPEAGGSRNGDAVETPDHFIKKLREFFLNHETLFFLLPLAMFLGLTALFLVEGFRLGEDVAVDHIGVCILLVLPLAAHAGHLVRKPPRFPLDGCIRSWLALVMVYLAWALDYFQPQWSEVVWKVGAWSLLAMTLLLAWAALQVTRDVVQRKAAWNRMRQHPVLSLLFFLALFLTVTYLLSFALRFMHLAEPNHHLHATTLRPATSPGPADGDAGATTLATGPSDIEGDCNGARPAKDHPWRVYFERSSNSLQADPHIVNNQYSPDAQADFQDGEKLRRLWNGATLEEVACIIREHLPEMRVQVQLVGRAGGDQVRDAAKDIRDNYELAQARATEVAHQLRGYLDGTLPRTNGKDGDDGALSNLYLVHWDQIEWMYFPLAQLPASPPKKPKAVVLPNLEGDPDATEELTDEYSVDIVLFMTHVKPSWYQPPAVAAAPSVLTLMDFLYFTIYTITTTGYGDLVPVSGFAKLVASLANLFELFFLVIFFNVLLATVNGYREDQGAPP